MFFKKKKKQNTNECRILFKSKERRNSLKRKNFKKNNSIQKFPLKSLNLKRGNPRVEKIKKIKIKNSVFNMTFLLILFIVFVGLAYIIINFIASIRGGTTLDDLQYEMGYVEGIPSVPIYPRATFVYEERKNEEMVLKMFNQGISVYRLPRNTRTNLIYDFYTEQLPKNGWEYLFTIPTSTEEKIFGQYWLKGEKGLRIYIENNDVWYELITKTEAQSGLTDRRSQEVQRKRILEASTEQTLLPDYPWMLAIPREYLTRYSSTDLGELQAVEIFEIAGKAKFLISPIGRSGQEHYDKLLDDFVEKKSENSDERWDIINTKVDFKKDREILFAKLTIDGQEAEGVVLINKRNFIIYAIIANEIDHPFFEQIINEIREP